MSAIRCLLLPRSQFATFVAVGPSQLMWPMPPPDDALAAPIEPHVVRALLRQPPVFEGLSWNSLTVTDLSLLAEWLLREDESKALYVCKGSPTAGQPASRTGRSTAYTRHMNSYVLSSPPGDRIGFVRLNSRSKTVYLSSSL